MDNLDNSSCDGTIYWEIRGNGSQKLRQLTLVLGCVMLISAMGCRRSPPDPNPAGGAGDVAVAKAKMEEAGLLYAQREDLGKVRQGVALLRQARVADPGNYEVAWRLAKHNYYLGAHTTDDDERDDAFREGIEFGKIAVQLEDGLPEGHFWLGANYGGDAENSTLASLSNVEDIKREMGTVIKLDERFEAGSAYLALGQLYLQAPRVLGGNVQTAIEYLERGIKIGPNNALLRLNLAKAYRAANRDGEARKQIEFIMQMTPDPQYVPEQNEAIREGQQLLKEMDER